MGCPCHPRAKMIYFSDVDVVLKLARCSFLPHLAELLGVHEAVFKAKHLASLPARTKKLAKDSHRQHLTAFCAKHTVIGGTASPEREQELLNAGMDPGESLLLAEAETTGGTVVTGDKRALIAYASASNASQRASLRVVCWEQLLLRVRELKSYEELRRGGCEGMEDDGLLRIAFSNGLATPEEHALAAIESYLNAVKKHSSDILFDFSTLR
jgi:hypothetical protein